MNAKIESRLNGKIGKLQSKEMLQVCNEKTLAKNLSSTRQKLVNLQHFSFEDGKAQFVKHVNFCAKKRESTLVGFDATAIKKVFSEDIFYQCKDERGINAVKAMSICVGILDKKRKDMLKKQAKNDKKK